MGPNPVHPARPAGTAVVSAGGLPRAGLSPHRWFPVCRQAVARVQPRRALEHATGRW